MVEWGACRGVAVRVSTEQTRHEQERARNKKSSDLSENGWASWSCCESETCMCMCGWSRDSIQQLFIKLNAFLSGYPLDQVYMEEGWYVQLPIYTCKTCVDAACVRSALFIRKHLWGMFLSISLWESGHSGKGPTVVTSIVHVGHLMSWPAGSSFQDTFTVGPAWWTSQM